jgi:hypothetical protein
MFSRQCRFSTIRRVLTRKIGFWKVPKAGIQCSAARYLDSRFHGNDKAFSPASLERGFWERLWRSAAHIAVAIGNVLTQKGRRDGARGGFFIPTFQEC